MRMLRRNSVCSVLLSSALFVGAPLSAEAACELPSQRPMQTKAEFSPLLDTQVFVDSVASTLGNDLMGYVVILQSRAGKIIAEVNYGYARTPCETAGVQPFTRNTTVTWGSVTKMVTAAAVIDRIEQSRRQSFDDRMADYLPRRWSIGEGWKDVKIRHLLSHQGGFVPSNPIPLSQRVATEETERPVGTREYSNANYSAWHFMGSFFGPLNYWKQVEDGYSSNEIAYDDYIWSYTRPRWKEVLRTRIFDPLGIKGECDQSDFNGSNYALYYRTPNQETGYFYNSADDTNCASGGMVMSPKDMGVFLHALTRTDKIVTQESYQSLMRIESNGRFGFDGSTAVSDGRFFWKNGAWRKSVRPSSIPGNTAAGALVTYIIDFPNGTGAVFASNSEISTRLVREILRDAYNAGVAASPPRRRPRR